MSMARTKRPNPATIPIQADHAAANPAPPAPAPRRRGRPKSAEPKAATPILMGIKSNDEYREWFDGLTEALARSVGMGTIERSKVFDRAVADLARALGYPPPPRRI